MGLAPAFTQWRTPPAEMALGSTELRNWYDEPIYYSRKGFSHNGTRITGDHFWLLNMQPLDLFYIDQVTGEKINKWDYGYYSKTDDWIFKQIEEADQSNMATAMMTGRGLGKTFIVLSIGSKTYFLEKGSKSIISAAIADHADPAFLKMKQLIVELEKKHPTLALKRLINDDDVIRAGEMQIIEGIKTPIYSSQFEKIVYANSEGKTKGRRIRFQQFEEWGDWSCKATLNDCIESSQGTWKVGDVYLCRVFFTGTGGTVKSDQARDIFYDPLAYNIMPVQPYNPKTFSFPHGAISTLIPDYLPPEGTEQGMFLPSIVKRGDCYEFDRYDEKGNLLFAAGEDDYEKALTSIMDERAKKANKPKALDKLTQEYPLTAEEVFRQSGAGEFDRKMLGIQKLNLTQKKIQLPLPTPCPEGYEPRRVMDQGRLEWVYKAGSTRPSGVEWFSDSSEKGKIFVAEHPAKDDKGNPLKIADLYIGGLDSIDQGKDDSVEKNGKGSRLALTIKKRRTGLATASNFYTCFYAERPDDPDDAFENVLKILWYYNCRVNLEYTKISIKSYFKERGEFWRFVPRMKVCLATVDEDKHSTLIGTHWDGAGSTFDHAARLLKRYLKESYAKLYYIPAVQELIDFTRAMRTKYDYVMAMLLTELADEDLAENPPAKEEPREEMELPVWYEDEHGYMQYGIDPRSKQEGSEKMLKRAQAASRRVVSPDLFDDSGHKIELVPLFYGEADYDGERYLTRQDGQSQPAYD